ncbi:MAG: hypothetical protein R6V85_21300 [Polyangia bacterium]
MAITVAVALLCAAPSSAALAGDAATEPGSEENGGAPGTSGVLIPLDAETGVELKRVSIRCDAIPPPRRTIYEPRFADEWELSVRMDLANPTNRAVQLELALPELAGEEESGYGGIGQVIFSLDELRLPVRARDVEDLPYPGSGRVVSSRRFSVDFEPGAAHRVDTLCRVPAPAGPDGSIRLHVLIDGVHRFGGDPDPPLRIEVGFGERVRLVALRGERPGWIADPPDGAEVRFRDDGDNSALRASYDTAAGLGDIELAARSVGPGTERGKAAILGETIPVERMNALELELARATYLAMRGRTLREEQLRELFEELPWESCNPAYRVVHGKPLETDDLEEALQSEPCGETSCGEVRRRDRDPFGPAWKPPLCWYSPVRSLSLTRVKDENDLKLVRAIEARLRELGETPPGPAVLRPRKRRDRSSGESEKSAGPEESDEPARGGCGCIAAGSGNGGAAGSTLSLLLDLLCRQPSENR